MFYNAINIKKKKKKSLDLNHLSEVFSGYTI